MVCFARIAEQREAKCLTIHWPTQNRGADCCAHPSMNPVFRSLFRYTTIISTENPRTENDASSEISKPSPRFSFLTARLLNPTL